MSSGDSSPQQNTTYNTNLPEYARPYFEHMLGNAEANVNQPYVQYQGQRVAQSTPFMNAYYQGISNMGPAYPVLEAQDTTRNAIFNSNQLGNYTPGTVSNQYQNTGYQPSNLNFNNVNAGQAQWGNFDSAAAAQYMSPYQQYVTDMQKQSAVLDYNRQRNTRNDSAMKANAFGGDRRFIMEGMGEEGLLNRLNSIQGSGLQNAFTNAQGQFNTDRSTSLQGQQFNLGNDLQAQLANQSQGLNAFQLQEQANQFGANFGDQSARYANDATMQAQNQNITNSLAGNQFNLAANAQALSGAQQLGGLGELFQNTESQRLGQLGQAGQLQQSQFQQGLDQQYQDFVNQRDYGRNNISWISSILHGLPVTNNSQSDVVAYTNPVSTAMGIGLGAAGLSKAMG